MSKPIQVSRLSLALLHFLHEDPRYIVMCERDNNYRARLTPKPFRVLGHSDEQDCEVTAKRQVYDVIDDWFVCDKVGWFLNGKGWYDRCGEEVIHPDLIEQLRVHDDLCLKTKDDAQQG